MLDPGDGIAVFGVCGMIATGIMKFVPRRNGNNVVSKTLCDERSNNIKEDISEVKADVKSLLKHFKIKE